MLFQVKRQGLLIAHTKIYTHTLEKISKRERGDLSLAVYLYGIRVTDVGGKFYLPKGLHTRSCLGSKYVCVFLLSLSPI